MNILIVGDDEQIEEIGQETLKAETSFFFQKTIPVDVQKFQVIFILNRKLTDRELTVFENQSIIINDVIGPLPMESLSNKIARFNGWPSFLKNDVWEVVSDYEEEFRDIFALFHRKALFVKDNPGLISARVISKVINEAFYALHENVSSKEEIDLAMKNGTNYPYGPFEWSEKIGLKNIYNLLSAMSVTDKSSFPAFTI